MLIIALLQTTPPHTATGCLQARDINLDIKRVVAYRYWCNKLWNAIKFAMMNLPEAFQPLPQQQLAQQMPAWPPAARWVLSRLNSAVETINKVRGAEMLLLCHHQQQQQQCGSFVSCWLLEQQGSSRVCGQLLLACTWRQHRSVYSEPNLV